MKYLSEQEERKLLRTVREIKGRKAERDFMIINLILNTGLRAGEVVGLTVGDIRNKEKLYVRPEIAKRSKARFMPINKFTQGALKGFFRMKLQNRESITEMAPLFISKKKNGLSKRALQDLIEVWVMRAGLTTTKDNKVIALYSVHSLRHTCFKRMRERGMKLEVIQKIAGHSSVASTGIYTEATYEEMEEAVECL